MFLANCWVKSSHIHRLAHCRGFQDGICCIVLAERMTLALARGLFQTIQVEGNFQKNIHVWQAQFQCIVSSMVRLAQFYLL